MRLTRTSVLPLLRERDNRARNVGLRLDLLCDEERGRVLRNAVYRRSRTSWFPDCVLGLDSPVVDCSLASFLSIDYVLYYSLYMWG